MSRRAWVYGLLFAALLWALIGCVVLVALALLGVVDSWGAS